MAGLTGFGISPEAAQAWIAQQDQAAAGGSAGRNPALDCGGPSLDVWPENWPVLDLFLRLQSQWHRAPSGGLTGLRYEAAATLMEGLRLRRQRRLWRHLQDMELAVLKGPEG